MKKIIRIAKLQFIGGQAKPGPNLASIGVNIMQFCTAFNSATQEKKGEVVPVIINVYSDKSFTFNIKTTPTSVLIKKFANLKKGSSQSKKKTVGELSDDQISEIAKIKMPDLNTKNIEQAKKSIIGTMKQMGIKVTPPTSLKN